MHGRGFSHFYCYVMARGHLQCYHGQGHEPGLHVGDEQVPLRTESPHVRPPAGDLWKLCYSTSHPLGVTLRVIATKLSGVNQPSFAGVLGWPPQLHGLDQRGQEHVVFFFVSSANNLALDTFQGTIELLIETMKGWF